MKVYGTLEMALFESAAADPTVGAVTGRFYLNTAGAKPVKYYDGTGWQTFLTLSTGLSNPMTTLGDTLYAGASGVATRLAGNTTSNKQFLTSTGSSGAAVAPVWAGIVTGDLPTTLVGKTIDSTSSLAAGIVAASFTVGGSLVTLPSAVTTLVGTGNTQTLSNKDLTSATNSFASAGASTTGMMTFGTQTFGGAKTFNGAVTFADMCTWSYATTTTNGTVVNVGATTTVVVFTSGSTSFCQGNTAGANGQVLVICATNANVTLKHNFNLNVQDFINKAAADLVLTSGQSAMYVYMSGKWRQVA